MRIKEFITYADAEGKRENETCGGLGGFFEFGMRWEDYLDRYGPACRLETFRKAVIENQIKIAGDEHQQSGVKSVALWEDGSVSTFSFRGWGDIMAAIWSSEDDKNYCYMDFYVRSRMDNVERLD